MQMTETKSEGLKREYAAKASAGEIAEKVDEKLEEVRPSAQLNGFRKGKVPHALLKKMYGKSVMGEVMQELVDTAIRTHLEEHGHRPTAQPQIRVLNESEIGEGDDLDVEISYELMPDIPEITFGDLELERLTVAVEESSVDEALTNIADNAKTYAEKDGAAETGDQAVIDFIGRVDGEAFEGGAGEDFPLVLGSNQFIPGFEDQLVGAAAGDKRDVAVTFPEAYGAKALAGKDAVFEVTVKEVRGPQASEIDDALAQKYGAEDLDGLKEQIRERLAEEFRNASRSSAKRKLLDKLDEAVAFELPPSMVEEEARQIAQQLGQESDEAVDPDTQEPGDVAEAAPADAAVNPGEPTEEHRTLANRRVKLGLLLADIGSKAEISVTEAEINAAIAQQARNYPGQERQFFEFARTNPQVRQQISAPLFEDKVVDYVLELAKVSERSVTAEELRKELEAIEAEDA